MQAKILKLLMDLQDRLGLSMLFVTHDIALARKVSDRLAVMLKGRIVETGATNEVLSHPEHPYTAELVDCASGRVNGKTGNESFSAAEILIREADRNMMKPVQTC